MIALNVDPNRPTYATYEAAIDVDHVPNDTNFEGIDTSQWDSSSASSIIFYDSTYFSRHQRLPTPDEVRGAAAASGALRDSTRPIPVKFPRLGLIVKYGPRVYICEGQSMRFTQHELCGDIPVPEVYGWVTDGEDVFIYMQCVDGPTLLDKWSTLSETEKQAVCNDLRIIVDHLGTLKQPLTDPYIGSTGRQRLHEYIFEYEDAGAFSTVQEFHDWFTKLKTPAYNNPKEQHPYRDWLPDDLPNAFTHCDLNRANVIMSASGCKVLAIVDWAQAGWLPGYWEYCKARHTAKYGEEWQAIYIPQIFGDRFEELYWRWDFFIQRLGY